MFRVIEQSCVGCGLCAENCPNEAISLASGHARIRQERCDGCGLCVQTCPVGAIVCAGPVSINTLRDTAADLCARVDEVLTRIHGLRGPPA